MVAIEHDIERLFQRTEESVRVITEGSDEHLDLILSINKPLDELTTSFQDFFNDDFFKTLDNSSDQQIEELILPRLKELNKSALMLIGAVRTSFLYRDIRNSLKNFQRQYDVLKETIHDLVHFRLAKDSDLNDLLGEINGI